MPNPSFRFNDELYNRMKEACEAHNIILSDLVRNAVAQWLDNNGEPHRVVAQETVELLKAQLQTKDEQISQLHQLVAMSQKHSDDLTKQLEDHYSQQARHWWQFWR